MNLHYNAFISYRHAPLDSAVAQDIQRRLEHFKIPAEIRKKTGVASIERVFRDQEELPITSNLGEDISRALENSDFLIVVCSSSTKESKWVEREVRYFLETHDRSRVLTAIAEGDPLEVIPEILLYDEEQEELEPLSCDYRKGFRKAHSTEIPRLAAPLIGCTYDDLVMRHRQYRMRRILAAMTAAMVLSVAALGYLIWSSSQIRDNYRNMLIQQSLYLSAESQELTQKEDRIPAALLALAALPGDVEERPLVPAALAALIASTDTYRVNPEPMNADTVWSFYTKGRLADYFCSEDGKLLVAWDDSPAVCVWRIQDRTLLWKKSTEAEIRDVYFPDERSLVIETGSGIEAVNPDDGAERWKLETDDAAVFQKAGPSGDGELIVVQRRDGALSYLSFLDALTGEVHGTSEAGIDIPLGCSGLWAADSGEMIVLELPDYREEGCRLAVYLREEDRFAVIDTGQERAREIDCLLLDGRTVLFAEHPENQNYAYSRNGLTQFVDKKSYVSLWREGEGVLWTKEFPFTESGYVTDLKLSAYKKAQEPVFLVCAGRNFMILDSADGEVQEEGSLPDTAAGCYAVRSDVPGFIMFLSDGTMLLWNEGTEDNLFLRDVFSGRVKEVIPFEGGSGNNAYLVRTEGGEIRLYEDGITDPGYAKAADIDDYSPEMTSSYVSGGYLVLRWYNTDLWGWQTAVYDPGKGVRTAQILPDRNAGGKYVGFTDDPQENAHRFYCLENTDAGGVRLTAIDLESGEKRSSPLTDLKPEAGFTRGNYILLFGKDSTDQNALLRIDAQTQEEKRVSLTGADGITERFFVSEDGSKILAVYKNGEEKGCASVDPETGIVRPVPALAGRDCTACAFREDGTFAVYADNRIEMFGGDLAHLATIEPDAEKIYFLHFDDGVLAAGGSDGVLRIFDAQTQELVRTTEYTASSVNTSPGEEGYLRWEKTADLRILITVYGADLFDAASWEHLCYIKGARGYDQEKDAFLCLKENPAQIGWLHRYSTQELIEKGRQFVLNAEMDAEKKARYGLAGE